MPRPFATAKYSHIQYFMFMFILVVANALKLQTRLNDDLVFETFRRSSNVAHNFGP